MTNPRIINNLVYNDDDTVPTVMNPLTGQLFVTNGVGRRVLELLDGTRAVDQLARQIHQEFEGSSLEIVRADVEDFLRHAAQQGLTT